MRQCRHPVASLICSIVLILAAMSEVEGHCWRGLPTVVEEFQSSSLAFVGTVISERQEQPKDGFYDGITYTLRVDESFKGSGRNSTELFSENSTARYPLKIGGRYLIFAYAEGGRRNAVYTCGNTEPFVSKSSRLAAVRRLAKQSQERARHASR